MSGQTFSTFTEVGMIDARTKTGIITLPTTTSIPYRILTLKDVYGVAGSNIVTLSTQTGDAFEDGSTTRAINAAWGMTTLYAGKPGTWYTIGGSVLTTANISSLTVSSIIGLTNLVSTPYLTTQLTSTSQGLGLIGYISSSQLTSTAQGLTTYVNTFIDPTELASSITGLGTISFISSIGLLSTSQGLANYITSFIDPQELASTVTGLGSVQYVSTLGLVVNVTSSLVGLGTMSYISSAQLVSTTAGIQSTDLLTTTSSLRGLGTMAYLSSGTINVISTPQLLSTVTGLGTVGYVSTSYLSTLLRSTFTIITVSSL
jgi:hypothetical protein